MSYKYTCDFNPDPKVGPGKNLLSIIENLGVPRTYIEIGVYEGGTLFPLSDLFTRNGFDITMYAIDPHTGSNDLEDVDFTLIKEHFEHNLSVCENKNIHYIPKRSEDGLIDLINKNVKAELIYIDGDHRAGTVLTDLVLAWKLLNNGGVIMCDDSVIWQHKDKNGTKSAQMSPRMAIEMFIQCHWHELEPYPLYGHTAFMKIS